MQALLAVPAQINLGRHLAIHHQRMAGTCGPRSVHLPGLFNPKTKAPPQVLALRHGLHHTHHIQILPLEHRLDGADPRPSMQARHAKGSPCPHQGPSRMMDSPPGSFMAQLTAQPHSASHHGTQAPRISLPRPQDRLLQGQCHPHAPSGQGPPQTAGPAHRCHDAHSAHAGAERLGSVLACPGCRAF